MPTIYDALVDVAKKGRKFPALATSETTPEYLKRLTQAVSNSSKDDFDAMPEAAQLWFDAAADALNEGGEVPEPEGFDREEILGNARPRMIGRPREKLTRGDGKSAKIRRAVIANPNITLKDLTEKMHSEGVIDPSASRGKTTVATLRYDTLATLKLLADMGWRPPA